MNIEHEATKEEAKNENLPTVIADDGFADGSADDRLIQGTIIRCVDGRWTTRDGTAFAPETRLLALAVTQALQHWHDQMPVETIIKHGSEPLPNVDELNAKIPEAEWEDGLDGNPRPPWVKQHVVYLLDPKDASLYTFINSTVGALIAVERLKDKVKWMRALRGAKVVPVVKLDAKQMPTKRGPKMRPEFTVLEWRDLGGLPAATAVPALEHIGQPVAPPSVNEELNDTLPF
jgi:hypothetical protein